MRGVGWAGSFRGNAFTFTTVSRDSHQRRNSRSPKWVKSGGILSASEAMSEDSPAALEEVSASFFTRWC